MFGFVKVDKEKRVLGGEMLHEKKRRNRILFTILGILGFVLLNLVLYYMTNI